MINPSWFFHRVSFNPSEGLDNLLAFGWPVDLCHLSHIDVLHTPLSKTIGKLMYHE